MTRFLLILAALLVSGIVSGCGIKGSLATPAPVFGGERPVLDAPPLASDVEEDGEEDPEPFYGPDFEDPLNGRDE